jgi:hypothetical protein
LVLKDRFGIINWTFGKLTFSFFNGAMNHRIRITITLFLVIIASICYAKCKLNQKKFLSDLSPVSITTGNFLVLLFPSLAILYFTGFSEVIQVEKYSIQLCLL